MFGRGGMDVEAVTEAGSFLFALQTDMDTDRKFSQVGYFWQGIIMKMTAGSIFGGKPFSKYTWRGLLRAPIG